MLPLFFPHKTKVCKKNAETFFFVSSEKGTQTFVALRAGVSRWTGANKTISSNLTLSVWSAGIRKARIWNEKKFKRICFVPENGNRFWPSYVSESNTAGKLEQIACFSHLVGTDPLNKVKHTGTLQPVSFQTHWFPGLGCKFRNVGMDWECTGHPVLEQKVTFSWCLFFPQINHLDRISRSLLFDSMTWCLWPNPDVWIWLEFQVLLNFVRWVSLPKQALLFALWIFE